MLLFTVVTFAVATCVVNGQDSDTCDFETWVEFGDFEYWVAASGLSWELASCSCRTLKGQLARPETLSQLADLSGVLDCLGTTTSFWLGAYELENSDVWVWEDGTEVAEDVLDWYDGHIEGTLPEPRPSNDSRCVRLSKRFFPAGIVADERKMGGPNCDLTFPYVCQREVIGSCPLDKWVTSGCTQFQIPSKKTTWARAQTYCENLGGHLAKPSSDEERDVIYGMLDCLVEVFPDFRWPGVYIGANDLNDIGAEPRVWRWHDGTIIPESDQDFLEDVEVNESFDQNCITVRKQSSLNPDAYLVSRFFWSDLDCTGASSFVCQRVSPECAPPTTTPAPPPVCSSSSSSSSSSCCSSSSSSSSSSCCSSSSSSSNSGILSVDISV